MQITLSKTDYLLYRDCKRNAWIKIHKPDIYSKFPPSELDLSLMEAGHDIELIARQLFPSGILVGKRGEEGQEITQKHILNKEVVLFQPVFIKDGFVAIVDVLKFNPETNSYSIYEIKSTNDIDRKIHPYDLAFQVNVLRKCGLKIESINLIHFNSEYIRSGDLNINLLFKIEDLTQEIESLCEEVALEMDAALKYLSQEALPDESCSCMYKGRSNHCATFTISNPQVPKYSVHDITRIGSSKAKLAELIDGNIVEIDKIPVHIHIKLSGVQQNQIDAYKLNKLLINKDQIMESLESLEFPLYFLDYETFPSPIPRFNGFSPYAHIPFQYSLYILRSSGSGLEHLEFLHTDPDDPTRKLIESLKKDIGDTGNIIVWHKSFESNINNKIAERISDHKEFIELLNNRIYDLEEIFLKQHYVDKDFLGKTSIKNILPVLVPELSYKELSIQDGTAAFRNWDRIITENLDKNEKDKIIDDLKKYCGLDTYAMYMIWNKLSNLS